MRPGSFYCKMNFKVKYLGIEEPLKCYNLDNIIVLSSFSCIVIFFFTG